MKKLSLNPLSLDKQTIALLDANQLQNVVGGLAKLAANSTGCGSGASTCGSAGGSTGCGSGASVCPKAKMMR
ncbi:MAG: class I lanthipeptide [Saprospiraceae bacterium]